MIHWHEYHEYSEYLRIQLLCIVKADLISLSRSSTTGTIIEAINMKYYLVLTLLCLQFAVVSVSGSEVVEAKPRLFVFAEIYRLLSQIDGEPNKPELFYREDDSHTLEATSSLILDAGEKTALKIALGDESGEQENAIVIHFDSDKKTKNFNVRLELQGGQKKVISQINGSRIAEPLSISTELDGVTRNIYITVSEITEHSCGRVSTFHSPPSYHVPAYTGKFSNIHRDKVFAIDGKNVFAEKTVHQLTPGKHVISVGRKDSFELVVEPNKTYHVGVRNVAPSGKWQDHSGMRNRFNRKSRPWYPVIWQITDQDCSL